MFVLENGFNPGTDRLNQGGANSRGRSMFRAAEGYVAPKRQSRPRFPRTRFISAQKRCRQLLLRCGINMMRFDLLVPVQRPWDGLPAHSVFLELTQPKVND